MCRVQKKIMIIALIKVKIKNDCFRHLNYPQACPHCNIVQDLNIFYV